MWIQRLVSGRSSSTPDVGGAVGAAGWKGTSNGTQHQTRSVDDSTVRAGRSRSNADSGSPVVRDQPPDLHHANYGRWVPSVTFQLSRTDRGSELNAPCGTPR